MAKCTCTKSSNFDDALQVALEFASVPEKERVAIVQVMLLYITAAPGKSHELPEWLHDTGAARK